jgi:hypothetical protein
VLGQSKLIGEKIGVGTNAFGVTTRATIMRTEGGDHPENLCRGLYGLAMTCLI